LKRQRRGVGLDPRPRATAAGSATAAVYRLRGAVADQEVSLPLAPGPNQVGSDPVGHIVLEVPEVSRRHALVLVEPGRMLVIDEGSKNGTYLNGRKVRRAEARIGDRVAFGPVELRIEAVHPDDTRLAVEISAPSQRRTGRDDAETATAVRGEEWEPAAPRPEAARDLRLPPGYVAGPSAAMRALHDQVRAASGWDLPVLLVGETGVGKELLVEALHLSSGRGGPLVAINCAAVPADLLEAELFGIGSRVATGVAGRRGRFQEAEGGTLFLDEIGDMPLALQAKLLRVLQDRHLHPLGLPALRIDLRTVAATNADVAALLATGRLRSDLYYRLAGLVLEVPPLRERREDIPTLVESFLRRLCRESGKEVRGVTVRGLQELVEHDWPGNVRELQTAVRRLAYECPRGGAIEWGMVRAVVGRPRLARGEQTGPGTPSAPPSLELADLERRAILEALRRSAGNQVHAAKLLGISRHRLRRRLSRYGLPADGGDPREQAAEA
jgi:DNA-binding NtrC family response regulator